MESVRLFGVTNKPAVKDAVVKKLKKGRKAAKGKGCDGCAFAGRYVCPEDFGRAEFLVVRARPTCASLEDNWKDPEFLLLKAMLDKIGHGYRVVHLVNCLSSSALDGDVVKRCKPQFLDKEFDKFDKILLVGDLANSAVFGKFKTTAGEFVGTSKISWDQGFVKLLRDKKIISVRKMYKTIVNRFAEGVPLEELLKTYDKSAEIASDILRMKDLLEDTPLPFIASQVTDRTFEAAVKVLEKSPFLVVDVETSSLDTRNCLLYTVSISGLDGVIFEFSDMGLFKKAWDMVSLNKGVVMHKATFDYEVMVSKGFDFTTCTLWCTAYLSTLIDALHYYSPTWRLKDLGRVYLQYKYWRQVVDFDNIRSYALKDVLDYNAEDVFVTRGLFKLFIGSEDKAGLLTAKQIDFYKQIGATAIKVIGELELGGIRVDTDELDEFQKVCDSRCLASSQVSEEFLLGVGEEWGELNVNSGKQMTEFFKKVVLPKDDYRVNGILESTKTKTGFSTSKGTFEKLVEALEASSDESLVNTADFLRSIMMFRKYDKLRGTFLSNFRSAAGEDSRVRASYNLLGTVSGRLSSSSPNLQNVPKFLRKIFKPAEGKVYVDADLSQAELRVAGIVANDEEILRAYKEGADLHKLTASIVAGVDMEDVTSDMRQRAKACNFGFLYGMQAPSFKGYAKAQYGVEYSDAEAVNARDSFFSRYAGLKRWHDSTPKILREVGHIESPFGRFYVFDLSGGDFNGIVRKALNLPVQGSAADLTMYIMDRMYEWKIAEGLDVKLVATVHDSMTFECAEALADRVMGKIKEVADSIQTDVGWVTVPIVVDVAEVMHW